VPQLNTTARGAGPSTDYAEGVRKSREPKHGFGRKFESFKGKKNQEGEEVDYRKRAGCAHFQKTVVMVGFESP